MPTRVEIVLKRIYNICIAGVAGSIAAMVLMGTGLRGFFKFHFMFYVLIGLVCLAAVSGVILLPVSLARFWLSRKRISGQTESMLKSTNETLILATNSLPIAGPAFHSGSLLFLGWSIDYQRALRLNVTQIFLQPRVWLGILGSGVLYLFLSFVFVPFPTDRYLIRIVAFITGALLDLIARAIRIPLTLRKTFRAEFGLQNYGLVVNPDAIVFIVGDRRYVYPWAVVGRTWQAMGIVLYQRDKSLGMIPDYAFKSNTDAKAFVATINALKKGLPPPPHDWSSYVPPVYTSEGIWPPPIA